MEKFGRFKFKIFKKEDQKGWHYQIFDEEGKMLRNSYEIYLFEGIARFAAIGHIALLEQKKD